MCIGCIMRQTLLYAWCVWANRVPTLCLQMKHFNAHFICSVLLCIQYRVCFQCACDSVCAFHFCWFASRICGGVEICLSLYSHSVILMMKMYTVNSLLRQVWGICNDVSPISNNIFHFIACSYQNNCILYGFLMLFAYTG